MIKNIIILVVLALLFLSASNLTSVFAQMPEKEAYEKSTKIEEPDGYAREVNERFVINAIKELYDAEAEFILNDGVGNFGRLLDLKVAGLIDTALASGQKYGYQFSIIPRNSNVGVPPGFLIEARPLHYRRTGIRSFRMEAKCIIRGDDKGGDYADVNDPVIDVCSPYLSYQWEYDMSQGMRQLQAAEARYFKGAGNGSYGSYQDLVDAGLIDYLPSWNWYTWLSVQTFPATETEPARFTLSGRPQIYRETGIRSYFADETGVLRASDLGGYHADETAPPLVFENEELAKYALRMLWKSQRIYRGLDAFGNGYFATDFQTLSKIGFIDFEIKNFEYGGYRFEMSVDNNEDEPWFRYFEIKATPLKYGKATARSFFISDRSFLRGSDNAGQPVDSSAPIVEF